MLIKEIMNVNVKTIKPGSTVETAAKEMTESRIGSLVVITSEGQAVGIVTERDILTHVVAKGRHGEEVKIEEIMSKELITISPENTIEEAAKLMAEKKIKKLPVIHEGNIVGVITASDLIAFEEQLVKKLAELIVSPEVRNMGG